MNARRDRGPGVSLFAFQDIITSVTGILILVALLLSLELSRPRSAPAASSNASRDAAVLQEEAESLRRRLDAAAAQFAAQQQLLTAAASMAPAELKRLAEGLAARLAEAEAAAQQYDAAEAALEASRERGLDERLTSAADELAATQREIARLQAEIEAVGSATRILYNRDPRERKRAWVLDLAGDRLRAMSLSRTDVAEFPVGPAGPQGNAFAQWLSRRNPRDEYFVLAIRPAALPWWNDVRKLIEQRRFDMGVDLVADDAQLQVGVGGAP